MEPRDGALSAAGCVELTRIEIGLKGILMNLHIGVAGVLVVAGSASAAVTNPPRVVGSMKHVFITLDGTSLGVSLQDNGPGDGPDEPVVMDYFAGDVYDGDASVLNGAAYSSRYGWLAGGLLPLDVGESIWVEAVSVSDGLEAYEGGMRMMAANHTYDAVLGTGASDATWEWSGAMTHNWYAVRENGLFEATYRVFVGDEFGNEITAYSDAEVTLRFESSQIPAPGAASLAALGVLAGLRRHR